MATTSIYTLSLHDALPILDWLLEIRDALEKEVFDRAADLLNLDVDLLFFDATQAQLPQVGIGIAVTRDGIPVRAWCQPRSEEHTSELQSLTKLVCRLLLEK